MKRILAIALVSGVALAGCSTNPQPSGSTTTAAPTDGATGSTPTDAPPTQPGTAPFVRVNCTVQGYSEDMTEPPADAVELNGVYVANGPEDVPVVTIAANLPPATDLGVLDIAEGTGAEVKANDSVTVDYCGIGQASRALFDSSWIRGEPISFPLSNLIPGWQDGLLGMKEGGRRLLIIPGELAYGENPPPGIGINETLIFIVQLDKIDS